MEKRLENKFSMYKVVRDWLNSNITHLEKLPGFTETFNEYTSILDMIVELDKNKTAVTSGITKTKGEAREKLEIQIAEMVRILKVHATFNNNQVLLNDIDFTESQLSRSSEQLLLVRANKIAEHGTAVQELAEALGLTPERLDNLNAAIRTFEEQQSTVRSAIVNRKDSGEQLDARMDEIDDLLKGKIDLLMELSQNTQPELYNQYKASRMIIDR
jgi:hypothetical protein